jgi:hypothetical protein
MKTIETTMDIHAPVHEVWAALTDFARYPEWSRFLVAIDGEARAGARLEVQFDDGSRPMTLRPRVLAAVDGQELRWRGVIGAGFLMSGEHYFRLTPLPGGGTRLCHGETFRGMLVPLVGKTLDTRTRGAFGDFNAALRERAEAAVAGLGPS